jgi:hypothetical protein
MYTCVTKEDAIFTCFIVVEKGEKTQQFLSLDDTLTIIMFADKKLTDSDDSRLLIGDIVRVMGGVLKRG